MVECSQALEADRGPSYTGGKTDVGSMLTARRQFAQGKRKQLSRFSRLASLRSLQDDDEGEENRLLDESTEGGK